MPLVLETPTVPNLLLALVPYLLFSKNSRNRVNAALSVFVQCCSYIKPTKNYFSVTRITIAILKKYLNVTFGVMSACIWYPKKLNGAISICFGDTTQKAFIFRCGHIGTSLTNSNICGGNQTFFLNGPLSSP